MLVYKDCNQKVIYFQYVYGYTFSNVMISLLSFLIIFIYLYDQIIMLVTLSIVCNLIFYFTFLRYIQLDNILQIIKTHNKIYNILENTLINNTIKQFLKTKLIFMDFDILIDFLNTYDQNESVIKEIHTQLSASKINI